MDLEEVMEAGGAALIGRWLGMALAAALPEGEDDSGEVSTFKLMAAKAAVQALAGEDAPLEERMQAVLYVIAHSATIEQQARANSRFVPPPERAAAQRFAARVMSLSGQQLSSLQRLRAARAKEEAAAGRAAEREAMQAHKAGTDRDLALVRMLERQFKELTGGGAALDEAGAAAVPQHPPPVRPDTPPEAVPNRRMRRAAARQARLEAREPAPTAAE